MSYFPLRLKVTIHVKFIQSNIYVPHNLLQILMLEQHVNLLFAIKLSSDFVQGSNIYKLRENYTQIHCSFHCSW